ncbi:hypothetical protein [Metabacillus indicus]|uniref:hypothetical protein n=1 Tax=Metabacillus indicus TaxID=246786 RepID=UPI003CEBCDE6
MNTVKLSLEELIFSFYSEGLYEQGIGLKQTYFPEMNDEYFTFMLEIASRSLMAKDMIMEVDNQYRLKPEYSKYMRMLNSAEGTYKASKFSNDLTTEETVSFHKKDESFYLHKISNEQQVHTISKKNESDAMAEISEFLQFSSAESNTGRVLFSLTNAEFEWLLEAASTQNNNLSVIVDRFSNLSQNPEFELFITDLINRNAKMDSLLYITYDADNNSDLVDIIFIVPGRNIVWAVTRLNADFLEVKEANSSIITEMMNKTVPS